MTDQRVVLCRELSTDIGTFSSGCTFEAERVGKRWRLNLLLSRAGGPDHSVIVADTDVYPVNAVGQLVDAAAAEQQYRFARNMLGLSSTGALAWLIERYGLTPVQLERLDLDRHIRWEVM